MAMLAERKRKQKFSLNPRGKEWVQDSSKFGQKMLEKMGWKPGKGLGLNENGSTNHIRVSYKNDSKGMGYKDNDEEWSTHGSNFTALLEQLGNNGETSVESEIKPQSLEEKSQNSRARVHYHKFTRGKDLSRYSEKDLANIFGKKSLKEEKIAKKEAERSVENFGVPTVNGGSMTDYFQKKTKKKVEDSTFVSYICEENGDSGFEEIKPKKKRKRNDPSENLGLNNPSFNPMGTPIVVQKHILEPIVESEEFQEASFDNGVGKKKSKKRKLNLTVECEAVSNEFLNVVQRRAEEYSNPLFNETDCTTDAQDNSNYEVKRKKLKKIENTELKPKKSKKSKCQLENGFENPVLNGLPQNSFEAVLNDYMNVVQRRVEEYSNPLFNETDCTTDAQNNSNFEVKRKKLKKIENTELKPKKPKKSKCQLENGFENPVLNDGPPEIFFEVKRKKSKKLTMENGIENVALDDSQVAQELSNQNSQAQSFEVKRKKMKKSKMESGIANPALDDSTVEVPNQNSAIESFEIKRKKPKKSKMESGIANPALDDSNLEVPNQNSAMESFEIKRKKLKKSKLENGIDNPALEDLPPQENVAEIPAVSELSEIPEFDIMLNVTSEPGPPSSPRKSKIRKKKSVRFSNVTQERIIPNETVEINKAVIENGLSNAAFDEKSNYIEENIQAMARTIDRYQAEVENDINEGKLKNVNNLSFGEITSDGENEPVAEGVKLRFKYAGFGHSPFWMRRKDECVTSPKKSYKHLIKGDIIVGFKNTNLHEIGGYSVTNKRPRASDFF